MSAEVPRMSASGMNADQHIDNSKKLYYHEYSFLINVMYKAYKFKLKPNTEQEIALAKSFGCCRWFWNVRFVEMKS
jgi:putative transposase